MPSAEKVDVLIIGGGVVGSSVARHVAARGAHVLLVDGAPEGGLGSRAAAGVDVPSVRLLGDPPMLRFAIRGRGTLRADIEQLGLSATMRRGCGVLRPVASVEEADRLSRAAEGFPGLLGTWIAAGDLAELEPTAKLGIAHGAFRDPDGGVVDAPAYLDALLDAAQAAGARVLLNTRVEGIEIDPDAVVARLAEVSVRAERLVLAAGAWSGAIPGLPALPVAPVRGQLIRVAAGDAGPRHVLSGPLYVAPAPDESSALIGATEEHVGFEPAPTVEGVLMLAAHAARTCPGLRSRALLSTWYGFRAATPDGRPLIGCLPGHDRVVVATGHGGQGILTGALTGRLVDELLATGAVDDLEPFDPAREMSARCRSRA